MDITRTEDGIDEGICGECGLNVGQVLTKDRYDKALTNLRKREEDEKKKVTPKKKGAIGEFFS